MQLVLFVYLTYWRKTRKYQKNLLLTIRLKLDNYYLLFTGAQKSYGPEIARFLTCKLQFLENLRQLFIFANYVEGIDQFTLDLLKRSDT